jgi:hypothetical protein
MENKSITPGNQTTQALTLVERPDAPLALNRPPDVVLEEATRAAKALADVIENKKKKVVFNGETYLEFEDWQTLGRFYGVTARVRDTREITFGKDTDYETHGFEASAEAVLVSTNQVISAAEAMCMTDEPKWSYRPVYRYENGDRIKVGEEPVPLFQLRSMAQTRACAKALRNVLAWVVVLAGYKPTPAEEMDGVINGGSGNSGRAAIKPTQRRTPVKPNGKSIGPEYEENPFHSDRRA